MNNITDYIICFEDVLDLSICDQIIKDSENEIFESAGIIREINKNNARNCYMKKLNDKHDKKIYESVGKILQKYAEKFFYFSTGLTTEDTGYDHLIYKGSEKGEYKTHVDHFDLNPRVLSCSFILNDKYDGGDFSFFEGKHIVKKKAGSAVVFPSNFCFPHAVTPVTNGDRHAIITWIH